MAKRPTRPGSKAGASPGSIESIDELPADGKLYYRIGEVSVLTGVKPYVLRYWESEFRWMAPQKSRSKQRLYRRKDIEMILTIKNLLYQERYTIAGARRRLKELGLAKGADPAPGQGPLDHRREYRRIRGELEAIRALL